MINLKGLRNRESDNEIVHYIQHEQPKLNYPNINASFPMNTHQYSSLLELDSLSDQDETIKQTQVVQSVGATRLTHHIVNTRSTGSGGPEASASASASGPVHGPAPAPTSKPQSLLNYFKPSQAASSSSATQGDATALQRPASLDMHLTTSNAALHSASQARATTPRCYQPSQSA